MNLTKLKKEQRPGNTGFASGVVTCKLGALCFYSSSVLVDSFVLLNPPRIFRFGLCHPFRFKLSQMKRVLFRFDLCQCQKKGVGVFRFDLCHFEMYQPLINWRKSRNEDRSLSLIWGLSFLRLLTTKMMGVRPGHYELAG
jgi:hypothetical protein